MLAAGDVNGFVGNTGNAARTPPHLHYGICRGAVGTVNPYPWLTASADDRPAPWRNDDPG